VQWNICIAFLFPASDTNASKMTLLYTRAIRPIIRPNSRILNALGGQSNLSLRRPYSPDSIRIRSGFDVPVIGPRSQARQTTPARRLESPKENSRPRGLRAAVIRVQKIIQLRKIDWGRPPRAATPELPIPYSRLPALTASRKFSAASRECCHLSPTIQIMFMAAKLCRDKFSLPLAGI
jgi:hypothetical protein